MIRHCHIMTLVWLLATGTGLCQDRLRISLSPRVGTGPAMVAPQSAVTCQEKAANTAEKKPAVRKSVYGILSLNPEGRLRSSDASGFYSNSGATVDSLKDVDSWMPTAHLGLGVAAGIMDLEFMVGGGAILNEDFRAEFGEAVFSPMVHLATGVKVGPYVSVMRVEDADWRDASSVRLEGGNGMRSGISLALGNEKAWFTVGAGYVDFSFDASTRNGWTPSTKELDLSGWLFHLGVAFTF